MQKDGSFKAMKMTILQLESRVESFETEKKLLLQNDEEMLEQPCSTIHTSGEKKT